jgi:hypothetical protein
MQGSDIQIASRKVAAIVEAAERAAEELRVTTEQRARERIDEATRAADLRVAAAEEEASELLAAAQAQAEAMKAEAKAAVRHIHESARRDRDEADRYKVETVAEAGEAADRVRREGDDYAEKARIKGKADAREIIMAAHGAAQAVQHEGTQLSGHLNELSLSLRRNAERLLNDVALAHQRLTANLDTATPPGPDAKVRATRSKAKEPAAEEASEATPARGRRGPSPRNAPPLPIDSPDADFDVPEFIPGER